MEDGGGETETEVHIAGGNVPQHHVPVSGGAEELSATTTPAEADTQQKIGGWRERESSSNNSTSKLTLEISSFQICRKGPVLLYATHFCQVIMSAKFQRLYVNHYSMYHRSVGG